MKKVSKLLNNPLFYLFKVLYNIQNIFLFFFRFLFYGNIPINTRISFFASIRNHKNIFLGRNVDICPNVIIWPLNLTVGNNVQINPGSAIYGTVKIGNDVMIAPNCMITGGNHGFAKNGIPMRFQESSSKGIIIEDDVWIGANSVILDGVIIRTGTVIAAGSVVTKDTLEYSINAGVPSKFVKFRI
ncbi:acyltransferase [uncultured Chryseobacterium sp.]|uniref:acyltransferase n=1 Tax=uncultured Chryseobacterium sp. TaxID=259322 RepID=UPI0025DE4257|nr:acyltransferase [uncultured Chryseobacterium sp.]